MAAKQKINPDIVKTMRELADKAREAYGKLAHVDTDQKNRALLGVAKLLRTHQDKILGANGIDMELGRQSNLSKAMLDRLLLTPERIEAIARGVEAVAALPDPVGKVLDQWPGKDNGLIIQRRSVPLGVVGIIYESRPNVTADAGALCLKSGNAAILRGGSDSQYTSFAIVELMQRALKDAGLPEACVQLVPTQDREAVGVMLTMNGEIDVMIPRGGKSLTERVMKESRVPTLLHLDGNCHTYIHRDADAEMALQLVMNAKMRRTGICGATESLLIDEAVVDEILPAIANALLDKGCELRGDAKARKVDERILPASREDWGTEYLDAILSIKCVKDVAEAVTHINRYGSHHTDAIVTRNNDVANFFCEQVDSAIVMVNSSTQFADGGEFGMGAEIGIATGRLHARGPVGLEQLTTYKYLVKSEGSIRK